MSKVSWGSICSVHAMQTLVAAAALPRARLLHKLVAELVLGFAPTGQFLQPCTIHESQGCEGLHPDFQKIFFVLFVHGLCATRVCVYHKKPEGGARHPGAGVIMGCNPLICLGARHESWVLWKSSKCSQLLSCFSRHCIQIFRESLGCLPMWNKVTTL